MFKLLFVCLCFFFIAYLPEFLLNLNFWLKPFVPFQQHIDFLQMHVLVQVAALVRMLYEFVLVFGMVVKGNQLQDSIEKFLLIFFLKIKIKIQFIDVEILYRGIDEINYRANLILIYHSHDIAFGTSLSINQFNFVSMHFYFQLKNHFTFIM